MATITRLGPADAERYVRFRSRMLREAPWAFSASPDDDIAQDLDHLRRFLLREDYAILAVAGADELVAVAGVLRGRRPKFAHRATVWGVYVDPSRRGEGLGRAVTAAAVDLARAWPGIDFIDIGVSAVSPEAHRLYQSLGFVEWGREPDATDIDGTRHDEIHMTLRLR
jgi:RimJ/RimL family protein N-acetyltransferase